MGPNRLRGANGSDIICVDGEYYKFFDKKWIARGSEYPG
jgi:hypothetical protein